MFSELRTRVEMTFIHRMMITTGIMRTVIACIPVKTATVCSMVSKIMYRTSEIEETSVRVYLIHPQITNIIHRINRTEKVFDVNQRPGEFVQQFLVQFAQLGGRNGRFLIGGRFPRCGGDCFRYGEQCAGGNQNGECQQLFSIHLMTPLVGLLNVV